MITLLKKIAIFEPVSETLIVLSNITEGIDGSAAFFYNEEAKEFKIEDNQTIKDRITHTIDCRVLKNSSNDYATLEGFALSQTPVIISSVGIDGGLIINEQVLLRINNQMSGNDVLSIHVRLDAVAGYADGVDGGDAHSGCHAGKNLLMFYDRQVGNGSLLSGFDKTGGTTTEANGVQTLTGSGILILKRMANMGSGKVGFLFPFEGEYIGYYLEITSVTGNDWHFIMKFSEKDGTPISSLTKTVNSGETGVTKLFENIEIPKDTTVITLSITFGTGTLKFKNPMLGLEPLPHFTRY